MTYVIFLRLEEVAMLRKKFLILGMLMISIVVLVVFADGKYWAKETVDDTAPSEPVGIKEPEGKTEVLTRYETENYSKSAEAPEWFVIDGLVENLVNLTYSELKNFPMLSEVTMLHCIGSGEGGMSVTYNWTGVPLFYLLNMAEIVPGNYREVVFNATDGFSSSVLLTTAMDPTSILALEANGTDLEQVFGFGSGYRVVFPCKWGYKWVKWIEKITVVDYDYKGYYEQYGLSDEAIKPNCTMPSTNPSLRTFNATNPQEYAVQVLSNSSIESFSYEFDKMIFNVTGTEGSSGYFYVTFPKELLASPYLVYVDENIVNYSQTEAGDNVYLHFTYTHSGHKIEIDGTLLLESQGSGSRRPVFK